MTKNPLDAADMIPQQNQGWWVKMEKEHPKEFEWLDDYCRRNLWGPRAALRKHCNQHLIYGCLGRDIGETSFTRWIHLLQSEDRLGQEKEK